MQTNHLPPGLRTRETWESKPAYFEEVEVDGNRYFRLRKDSVMFPIANRDAPYVELIRDAILAIIHDETVI